MKITISRRDITCVILLSVLAGITVGIGFSDLLRKKNNVYNAKVVKVGDRMFLSGNGNLVLPSEWKLLVESDVHCVRVNYTPDGYPYTIDVSPSGVHCNE